MREHLAALGFSSLDEAIGHTEVLARRAGGNPKAGQLDLRPLGIGAGPEPGEANRCLLPRKPHRMHFDQSLLPAVAPGLEDRRAVSVHAAVTNTDRAVGTLLGHEVTQRYGFDPLSADTITVHLTGSAGQSLGAFLPEGITIHLEGQANDYLAKGLCGGQVILRPPRGSTWAAEKNVIAGNVIGYGATSGRLFIRGLVGERFLVRNSGATAVVEGVGDHGCEYMTGGRALILGPVGRNFGAGMSGGLAYILDADPDQFNRSEWGSHMVLAPLAYEEEQWVRELLVAHAQVTGSPVARHLLSCFASSPASTAERFRVLTPLAYRAALDEGELDVPPSVQIPWAGPPSSTERTLPSTELEVTHG